MNLEATGSHRRTGKLVRGRPKLPRRGGVEGGLRFQVSGLRFSVP